MSATVYLIPTVLAEGATQCLPLYLLDAVKSCSHFFVENERTARRFLKMLWKEMVIDAYEWCVIKEITPEVAAQFKNALQQNKTIGIISEAGCPGVADPGAEVVKWAHRQQIKVVPLVGPSAILMALMGSGFNGQSFAFHGYIPIEKKDRVQVIRQLEKDMLQRDQTQIFMETPYRNNQLLADLMQQLNPTTRLCIAANISAPNELVKTDTVANWKNKLPDIHKQPAVFLIYRS